MARRRTETADGGAERTAIMLFTRDLRVHDNPALAAACERYRRVIPLFVLDEAILAGAAANRVRFLLDSLADLRAALRERGGDLVVRRGSPADQVGRLATRLRAAALLMAADVSGYAERRERRLAAMCRDTRMELAGYPGLTVVEPGAVTPAGGDHYRVFSPYARAWQAAPRRGVARPPAAVRLPSGIRVGAVPAYGDLARTPPSAGLLPGGETEARRRLDRWRAHGLPGYDGGRDDLAGDRTSRLSAYLRFGCVSPLELARAAGPGPFARQLAWRDFYHQVTAARRDIAGRDYRDRGDRWRRDPDALAAWREGRTGYPIVDAGMRQLRREGWMHNRARMITASFLCKTLYLDWRLGAAHFMDWLADGDIPDNFGNWQWVAGTGNDTRPNRVLNPLRQAARFDPEGRYVRRYVPELAGVAGKDVHRPWLLPAAARRGLDYPDPIVDPDEPPRMPRARGRRRP